MDFIRRRWLCILLSLGGAGLVRAATVAHASNQQDRHFIRSVAVAGMTEAHMAEMVQNSASSSAVKEFGAKLDQEGPHEYGQLSALAEKAGAGIPKAINISTNPPVKLLLRKKEAQFDRTFLRSEIFDEQRLISILESEATHGTNADIKAWADNLAAAREQELEIARALTK